MVAPLLHNKVPVYPDAVSNELPQLLVTATDGMAGAFPGVAAPLPAALVQPLTVIVTLYVPAMAAVAPGRVGFCNVLEYALGPVQL